MRTYKTAIVLSALMKVGTIPFHVMLVLQSCTDHLQVLPGSSCETFPSSSDGTYDIGNLTFDTGVKEEEEVNVKRQKVIGSGEEKCIDIKDEEDLHSEEEDYMDTEINKEVRMRIQYKVL
jgi:hypothetical protein